MVFTRLLYTQYPKGMSCNKTVLIITDFVYVWRVCDSRVLCVSLIS